MEDNVVNPNGCHGNMQFISLWILGQLQKWNEQNLLSSPDCWNSHARMQRSFSVISFSDEKSQQAEEAEPVPTSRAVLNQRNSGLICGCFGKKRSTKKVANEVDSENGMKLRVQYYDTSDESIQGTMTSTREQHYVRAESPEAVDIHQVVGTSSAPPLQGHGDERKPPTMEAGGKLHKTPHPENQAVNLEKVNPRGCRDLETFEKLIHSQRAEMKNHFFDYCNRLYRKLLMHEKRGKPDGEGRQESPDLQRLQLVLLEQLNWHLTNTLECCAKLDDVNRAHCTGLGQILPSNLGKVQGNAQTASLLGHWSIL